MSRTKDRNSRKSHAARTTKQSEVFGGLPDLSEMYIRTTIADKSNGAPLDDSHLGVQIYAALTVIPNQTVNELRKTLGVSRDSIVSMLATMEGLGLLLAEDDSGRLTVYRQTDRPIVVGAPQ